MAIKDASATLSSSFSLLPITGFLAYRQGDIDPISGSVRAQGSSRWSDLTTWNTFNNWITRYNTIIWTAPVIDVGEIKYFSLGIQAEYDGDLFYRIHISETGDFQGEETEYLVRNGDFNVPSFYGRFAQVTAFVSGIELRRMTITNSSLEKTIEVRDVNTSTLGGTNTARPVPLTQSVGTILDMDIKVKSVTPYVMDVYVSDYPNSVVTVPVVVSKAAGAPTFALYGLDNKPRDAVVDITLKTLPRQVMTGGNLVVIL
jgi:hypothetical protein